MELIIYLLKVSACSVLFFALYLLVLRKLTFFKINRFYLLLSLLISFTIPALQFTIEREAVVEAAQITQPVAIQEINLGSADFQSPIVKGLEAVEREPEVFNWLYLLPYLYGVCVACMLGLAAWRLSQLLKHTKTSVKEINGLKLVAKGTGFTNCSFFNYVFVDEYSLTEKELAVLLAHERVHAQQYHSVDKLLLMIAKAVLWFNPIIFLYDKALEEAHEYEADEATSKYIGTESYATLLLNLAVSKSQNPLIHNFVKSPIKQRIKMLFNSKSKNMKKLAYLLVLPIGLGLIWGFTIKVVNITPQQQNEFTLVIDAGHGGKDKGAQIGNYSEKAITLSMANKIKSIAESKGIKVVTTRDSDQKISLQERIKADGNILISLHVNSEPVNNDGKRNGIEVFIAPNDGSLKIAKANSIGHYVFKGIQNIQGIRINESPQVKSLFLLREGKVPGIVLELGYLTNKNDLKFITNEAKQNELAGGIVNGILAYKEKATTDEELEKTNSKSQLKDTLMGKTVKGTVIGFKKGTLDLQVGNAVLPIVCYKFKDKVKIGDEIEVVILGKALPPPPIGEPERIKNEVASYFASKVIGLKGQHIYEHKDEHYAFLYESNRARYAASKIKTIEKDANGTINKIVLNDEHGFTINLNVAAQQFKSNDFKKGDKILVKFIGEKLTGSKTYTTDKMIALYSDPKKYELINKSLYSKFYYENGREKVYNKTMQPKIGQLLPKPTINTAAIKTYPKPIVRNSSLATVNNSTKIIHLMDVTISLFNGKLEAKEAEIDRKTNIITAKKATFKTEKGKVIESDLMIFNLNTGAFEALYPQGKVKPTSATVNLLSKLNFSASESINVSKLGDQSMLLSGNVKMNIDNYAITGKVVTVDRYLNTITAYSGSVLERGKPILKGGRIELDLGANKNYLLK